MATAAVIRAARRSGRRVGSPALRSVVAAAAMVATLPGRTHGLGLVTEPLLADLGLDRVPFAALNLWATLLGAAFCLPVGWLHRPARRAARAGRGAARARRGRAA